MLVVHATRKPLDHLGPPDLGESEESTTLLRQWYATALFWKPQVTLFVNETTLLPLLVPPAPRRHADSEIPRPRRRGPRSSRSIGRDHRRGTTAEARTPPGQDRQPQRNRRHERIQPPCRDLPKRYAHARSARSLGPAGGGALQSSPPQAHQPGPRTGRVAAPPHTVDELTPNLIGLMRLRPHRTRTRARSPRPPMTHRPRLRLRTSRST